MALLAVLPLGLVLGASSQGVGTNSPEVKPAMPLWTCSHSGCTREEKSLTMDANWRWIHTAQLTNCYTDSAWDTTICPNPEKCSASCGLDGIDKYAEVYGVDEKPAGIELGFVSENQGRSNFGSRLYLMESESKYKMFRLKNREFTMTVDVSRLPCGLNGAVYFVEMDADGGMEASGGLNTAGAKYGTGYCDAQCPHDLKFIHGRANVEDWNSTVNPPVGKYGHCCAEMDIWEANSRATAYTPHPCSITGNLRCSGIECGDNEKGERYKGVCDKDGCDFNSYRMGDHDFYGRSSSDTVKTREEITVVTQFITHDGTDTGDLVDIRRFYVQHGQVIPNSHSSIAGVAGNSVSDQFCNEMKQAFGDINDFKRHGSLKSMGEALDRGMVLVFSLWDDSLANMLWLDAKYPLNASETTPGVLRGPCSATSGRPGHVRSKYPHASVKFSGVKVGEIGSTFTAGGDGGSDGDDEFGDDRRLGDVHI